MIGAYMDSLFERFLTKIKIADLKPYEEASFANLVNEKERNCIIGTILLPHYLSYKAYQDLFDAISNFTALGGFSMQISFTYLDEREYFPRLLEEFKEAHNCQLMDDVYFYDTENKVLFYYKRADEAAQLNDEIRKLNNFLDSISSSYKLLMQEKIYMSDDFSAKRDEAYQKVAADTMKNIKVIEEINSTYQPCKLKDVDKFPKVIVSGTIFKVEDRKNKKLNLIRAIEFYDGTDSIKATLFEGKKMKLDEILKYDVGVKVKIFGRPFNDPYSRDELVIDIDKIEVVPSDPLREDNSEEKRVELHLHTKFSSLDGLATFADYAKTAKRWGHKALAVTDHGVCQAFPKAQEAAKKYDIKVLYGTEFYVVDDTPKYIYNPDNKR